MPPDRKRPHVDLATSNLNRLFAMELLQDAADGFDAGVQQVCHLRAAHREFDIRAVQAALGQALRKIEKKVDHALTSATSRKVYARDPFAEQSHER